MKRKDCHDDFYQKIDAKVAEMDDYIERLERKKDEVIDLRKREEDVLEKYQLQPGDSKKMEKCALQNRLKKLFTKFSKTTESVGLALNTEPGDVGGSSQEAGDMEMGTEMNQSSESSDVRTEIEGKGKDLVVPGGDSGESKERNKRGEQGVSTDTVDISMDVKGLETGVSELILGSRKTERGIPDEWA